MRGELAGCIFTISRLSIQERTKLNFWKVAVEAICFVFRYLY